LWSRPKDDLASALEDTTGPARDIADVLLLPPIDGPTEVWAAGVTYDRSRSAREEESAVSSVYELVYGADRPELFYKSAAWRVVTDGEPVGIRLDSRLDVPEAELALVLSAEGRIVGYTVCNDMSSRSIEGENPLYLPQAKVYSGSCALATGIRPASDIAGAASLTIELSVERDGRAAWGGTTSTAAMHRSFDDLARWLFAGQSFPAGVVLATGTGIVPELDFSLEPGDTVRISIDEVGTLTNEVRAGQGSFSWLALAIEDPFVREMGRLAGGGT
jgi:2-dehydro-3-deoxy-D-arabinonate dehydratase